MEIRISKSETNHKSKMPMIERCSRTTNHKSHSPNNKEGAMTPEEQGTRAVNLAGLTAEMVLKQTGGLLPFAIGVTPSGEKKVYTMKGGSGGEEQFRVQVYEAIRADVRAGVIGACAIAVSCKVTHPKRGCLVTTVCVQVEINGQSPALVFREYMNGAHGLEFVDDFECSNYLSQHETAPFERVFS
jgi:hypothetical protein